MGTDPLALVLDQPPQERELAAFLASCLAIGRASLILPAARDLWARLGPHPTQAVAANDRGWDQELSGFGYRFFSAARVAALLRRLGQVYADHGSLEAAWASGRARGWEALEAFLGRVVPEGGAGGILVPQPGSPGAHKRLNLFLRWMVRSDAVDPGGWTVLRPADLFMPVDTHVLRWAQAEGLTRRRTADRRAVVEITAALAAACPEDPLRWDFAITREAMAVVGSLRPETSFH